MKILKAVINILFFLSCVIIVSPVWIELFSETSAENWTWTWAFDFHIFILCLANVVNWFNLDSKILKISIVLLIVVVVSLILQSVTGTDITSKIAITLKGLAYFVMIFYYYKQMLFSRSSPKLSEKSLS